MSGGDLGRAGVETDHVHVKAPEAANLVINDSRSPAQHSPQTGLWDVSPVKSPSHRFDEKRPVSLT